MKCLNKLSSNIYLIQPLFSFSPPCNCFPQDWFSLPSAFMYHYLPLFLFHPASVSCEFSPATFRAISFLSAPMRSSSIQLLIICAFILAVDLFLFLICFQLVFCFWVIVFASLLFVLFHLVAFANHLSFLCNLEVAFPLFELGSQLCYMQLVDLFISFFDSFADFISLIASIFIAVYSSRISPASLTVFLLCFQLFNFCLWEFYCAGSVSFPDHLFFSL